MSKVRQFLRGVRTGLLRKGLAKQDFVDRNTVPAREILPHSQEQAGFGQARAFF
jgi:hypothetical protein